MARAGGGHSGMRMSTGAINIWRYLIPAVAICMIFLFSGVTNAWAFDDQELAFLDAINSYRQENGLGTLTLSNTLSDAATSYSFYMGSAGFFSHYGPDGSTPWSRIRAAGYGYETYLGENLAAGYETSDRVMIAWQNSPDHNANMLNTHYAAIGIDRVFVPGSHYGWYWATEFGGIVDGDALAPPPEPEAEPQPAPEPEPAPVQEPLAPAPSATGNNLQQSDDDAAHIFGCGVKPGLSLTVSDVGWDSYSDYITGHVTVHLNVVNNDDYPAFEVSITSIDSSDEARVIDELPITVASSLVGSKEIAVHYDVQQPADSFRTLFRISAGDECGNTYTYP